MARPRKATAEIESAEAANRALYALLIAELEAEKLAGAMELARAAATAKFEPQLNAQKAKIADLTLQLETWYRVNQPALEAESGKKSITLLWGVVGRRLGNPTLKPLNRSWTWHAVGVKLRELYRGRFFRVAEPAIDRELVRAELDEAALREVGLKVEQEERIFVETDRSKVMDAK